MNDGPVDSENSVLVVDDNEEFRAALRELLLEKGFRVEVVRLFASGS